MSSRRTMILIAALVVGAIAAVALFTYVGGIEDRANDNAERVKIFKIVADIPKGTFGDEAFSQELIVEDQIPREFRPATAITDPTQIDGLVAVTNLPANSVVVTDQFVSPQESLSTFAELLDEDQVAVTVSIDQIHGVAGLLVPGDMVNMMISTPAVNPPPNAVFSDVHRFLFQKVLILAIGQTKKLEPGQTAATNPDGSAVSPGSGLITFAVPPQAAAQIVSSVGKDLYLTLVPKDYRPTPLPPFPNDETLPGETRGELTPYGPGGPEEN